MRLIRRLVIIGASLVLLACVGWLVLLLVLPGIVRRQAVAAMHDAGLTVVTLDQPRVTLRDALLTNIVIGSADQRQVRIGQVRATFTLGSLWRGRVRDVFVDDLHIPITIEGGTVNLGALTALTQSTGGSGAMPFDQLRVRSATVQVWVEGHAIALPMSASLKVAGDVMLIDAEVELIDPLGRAGGVVAMHASHTPAGTDIDATVQHGWYRASGSDQPVFVDDVGMTLRAALDAAHQPRTIDLQLRAGSGSVAGQPLQQMSAHLIHDATDARSRLNIAAAGRNWTLAVDNALVSGLAQIPQQLQLAIAGDVRFDMMQADDQPGIEAQASGSLTLKRESDDGLMELTHQIGGSLSMLLAEGMTAQVPQWDFSGWLTIAAEGESQSGGTISVAGAAVDVPAASVRVQGISAVVPVAFDHLPQVGGSLHIDAIQWRDNTWPAIEGTLRASQREVAFVADWPLFTDAMMRVTGDAKWGGEGLVTVVRANLPRAEVVDEYTLGRLVRALRKIEYTGGIALDAVVQLAGGRVEPLVTLTFDNATIASPDQDAAIEGLTGSLTFDGFTPVTTPGNQLFRASKAHMGKFVVSDLVTAVRVESGEQVLVERIEAKWLDGRVFSHAVRVDTADPVLDLTVFFDRVQLEQLLGLMAKAEDVTGRGLLYGRLPVKIRWPKIEFGEGYLYAAPGTGRLQVGNGQMVGDLLGRADARFGPGGEHERVKQNILSALTDLEYSVLRVDMVRHPDGSGGRQAKVSVAGRGRTGPNPQEIGSLNLNVSGLEEALELFLGIRQ